MKLNILFYPLLLQPCIAVQPMPKFCIHCKHFTKPLLTNNEFGKCLLFPRKIDPDNYYVTGKIKNVKQDYYYCSTVRSTENMCGAKGKFYQDK
jgi:hypothetical protein